MLQTAELGCYVLLIYHLPSLGILACTASCSVFLPAIGVLVISVFFVLGWWVFGSSVERSQKNS